MIYDEDLISAYNDHYRATMFYPEIQQFIGAPYSPFVFSDKNYAEKIATQCALKIRYAQDIAVIQLEDMFIVIPYGDVSKKKNVLFSVRIKYE